MSVMFWSAALLRRFLIARRRSMQRSSEFWSAPRGQLRIRIGDWLIKSQRLDIAAEFA
jgi:hypothetical protein